MYIVVLGNSKKAKYYLSHFFINSDSDFRTFQTSHFNKELSYTLRQNLSEVTKKISFQISFDIFFGKVWV